jgi:hypothetical protein
MAAPPRKRRLSPQPRRAIQLLELLSSSPHGATEALLVRVHGFNSDMITGLIRAGLATASRETMKAGAKPIEVVRLQITNAGRSAIESWPHAWPPFDRERGGLYGAGARSFQGFLAGVSDFGW